MTNLCSGEPSVLNRGLKQTTKFFKVAGLLLWAKKENKNEILISQDTFQAKTKSFS